MVIWVVVVLGVLGAAYAGYVRFSRVALDLDRLRPYAETDSYEAMFAVLQAKAPDADGFSFVVLGDSRSDIGMARRVLGRAAEEKPAFILSTGDLVRRGTVEEYVSHHMPLVKGVAPIPVIPVPGNHEKGPNRDFSTFKAIYGDERFSFDFEDCRFVGINNAEQIGLSRADLRFLDEELRKPGATHKFVVMHVPPRYMKSSTQGNEGRGFRWHARAFKNLMAAHGVAHVFLGHVHGFATQTIGNVQYTITGGGGAPLTEALDEEGNVHNFVVVHVGVQGVRAEVLRLKGDEWVRSDIP
ncbi:MAG: hypothetical protein GWP08_05745 [Nitrospiraceae bacterium]|nr:hypothetical protein [Nitrospiraceae bacterium]